MKCVAIFLVLAFASQSLAKEFSRCELVGELRRQGFPEEQMRDWVCLVERESNRRTDAIGKLNTDDSWDHGLFQINDRYWCSKDDKPGKDCNVTCADLRTDDITKASKCTKIIFKRHGFHGWNAWKSFCQKDLPDISGCPK